MQTVRLGDTGEQVSALCLGAMNFGTKLDEAGSRLLLDRYWQAGGRFIDTANNYAHWWGGDGTESESVLGRWMRERGNRAELFLATKVGFNTPKLGNSLSRASIRREIEGSLRRLGTDHVDLYYAHKDHRPDPLEETLGTFEELHREGKVRWIGCSNHRAWRIEEALLDYCAAHAGDFLLLGYSSTLGGAYDGRPDRPISPQYRGPANEARLSVLGEMAREMEATPVQLVYAWMLHSRPLALPLVSAGSLEQLDENLGSLRISLDEARMKRLDEAGDPPRG
jgi:aryl-alcohol dehydrogenase-like predicted oxidoreductase